MYERRQKERETGSVSWDHLYTAARKYNRSRLSGETKEKQTTSRWKTTWNAGKVTNVRAWEDKVALMCQAQPYKHSHIRKRLWELNLRAKLFIFYAFGFWASEDVSAHLGILVTLPWFGFLEMSTGIGSNSSSLPFSSHDMRRSESAVKEEEVKEWWRVGEKLTQPKKRKKKRKQLKNASRLNRRWSREGHSNNKPCILGGTSANESRGL